MAMAYTKVLKNLGVNFFVVGISQEGIKNFQEKTGITALPNGVPGWLEKSNNPAEFGIIAVSFECLSNTAIELMEAGIRKILLEKPAGLTAHEIKARVNVTIGAKINIILLALAGIIISLKIYFKASARD